MCALLENTVQGSIAGYYAFLRKPFKLAEITGLVDRSLAGGAAKQG